MEASKKIDDLGLNAQQARALSEMAVQERNASNKTCHLFRLILVSGRTINGGKESAIAGLGFAFGKKYECQGSMVVDGEIDQSKIPVTLQQAEISAATEGLLALRQAIAGGLSGLIFHLSASADLS